MRLVRSIKGMVENQLIIIIFIIILLLAVTTAVMRLKSNVLG
ncbi:MAG: hypothetical protein ACOCU6_00140 [Nanoarchaeota archaeon]